MPGNQVRVGVGITGAKGASSELDQLRDKFSKLQQQSAKGLAIGAGVAVASAGLQVLKTGIEDVIGGSIEAYRNAETAQARLTTSLKENIPAWAGDTTAIKGAISASEKLGFTNTETMDSLALLVGATHDQAKAMDILSVAQNYARYKNEDLLQAATDLTKVEGGSTRALKALGINLHTGATEAERMGAIMKVVGGQAQAFAGTDLGKMDAAEEKVNESQVTLGKGLSHLGAYVMPLVADTVENAANALDDLSTSLDGTVKVTDRVKASNDFLHNGLVQFFLPDAAAAGHALDQIDTSSIKAAGSIETLAGKMTDDGTLALRTYALVAHDTMEQLPGKLADDLIKGEPLISSATRAGIMIPLQDGVETARHQLVDSIRRWPGDIHNALVSGQSTVESGMQDLLDAEKHPLSRAKRIAKLEAELTGKAIAEGLKSSDPFVRTAAQVAATDIRHQLELLESSAPGYGRRTAKAYADGLESEYGYLQGAVSKFLSGAKNQLKASSPPGPESPLHEIDKWGERTGRAWVEGMGKGIASGGDFGLGEVASAFGGGSRGAKHATGGGGASRGGDIHIHINGVSVMTPGSAQELARQLEPIITRAQQRQGHLAGARAF